MRVSEEEIRAYFIEEPSARDFSPDECEILPMKGVMLAQIAETHKGDLNQEFPRNRSFHSSPPAPPPIKTAVHKSQAICM